MTEPPRRKRFQIHLSTAIVMMFVAGGLMWANFIPARTFSRSSDWHEGQAYYAFKTYGWPCWVVIVTQEVTGAPGQTVIGWEGIDAFNKGRLAIDIAVALIILGLFRFICEWQIRRRAAQKGA
jgi:hypothetical protein